jgi:hypothetical protein
MKTKSGMHDVGIGGEVVFLFFHLLLLTSERHGGDHGVGSADDKPSF